MNREMNQAIMELLENQRDNIALILAGEGDQIDWQSALENIEWTLEQAKASEASRSITERLPGQSL